MIIKNIKKLGYIKSRPGTYRMEGITVGGNPGFVLSAYPRAYPITAQQRRVRDAARACNIRKGMSRRELVTQMRECIPNQFR